MSKHETTGAIEINGNAYIIPAEEPQVAPVDPNCYCYRYAPNIPGNMRFKGIMLGRNWENRPFSVKQLSCYRQEEGEGLGMTVVNWDEMWPLAVERLNRGKDHIEIARELSIDKKMLCSKIDREKKKGFIVPVKQMQTPDPKPEKVGSQEPDQGQGESAPTSIPFSTERLESMGKDAVLPGVPTVMPIDCELPKEEEGFGPEDDEPVPYLPLVQPPEFNPDRFKLSLIEELICVAYRHNAPARATIGLVKDILEADLPEAG